MKAKYFLMGLPICAAIMVFYPLVTKGLWNDYGWYVLVASTALVLLIPDNLRINWKFKIYELGEKQ